ncbi:hypothetical protein VOLCADRAFT_116405, partial [Volvox carteri f. nagariensis]
MQENEYSKLQLRHLSSLRKELEQEVAELFPDPDPDPPPRCEFTRAVADGQNRCPTLGAAATAGAACCVLDEHQRIAACGSGAANYILHSFAPSPTFDLAAFSETTQPVPPGQRLPNRFVLHVVHADTGRTLLEPVVGVSGDVGWVSLGNVDGRNGDGGGSGAGGGGGGGGRVYFTRAAQRELWCLDVKQPPPPPQQQQQQQRRRRSEAAAAKASPRLVFREPHGQPIQLVQYGTCLYGETLGNTGVPLEVRLLGVCSAGADAPVPGEMEGPIGQSGAGLPIRGDGSSDGDGDGDGDGGGGGDGTGGVTEPEGVAVAARAAAAAMQAAAADQSMNGATRGGTEPGTTAVAAADDGEGLTEVTAARRLENHAHDDGVPLLPQRPGRQYSVIYLGLAPDAVTLAGGYEANDRGDGGASGAAEDHAGVPGRKRLLCGGRSSYCGSGTGTSNDGDCPGIGGSCDGGGSSSLSHGSSCNGYEALLLWLRDLDHPNGCLLLALVPVHHSLKRCDRDLGLSYVPPRRRQKTKLLELLAHNPNLRIVHVEVRPGGRVLCVREAVDGRGDPGGLYELDELQLDWSAVKQSAVVAAAADAAAAARAGCEEDVNGDGDGYYGWRSTALQMGAPRGESDPYMRTAMPLALVHRRRTVVVQGPRQHVLCVLAWGDDGQVTLACSNMAAAPWVTSVELLPYAVQDCGSVENIGGGKNLNTAALQVAATMATEIRCGDVNPRLMIERLWATSHDGAQVPITLCRMVSEAGKTAAGTGGQEDAVRKCGTERDPPLDYQPALQPLLRRGVAVAVAHVRGGGLLGPAWYDAGRGAANKANSYLDLLAAARHLVATGVTTPGLMCLAAESAGGWAAGAALNEMGTRLFRAAVLTVPTLDVMTSLLEDPTYGPYELGDPRADPALYRAVLRWSPYDGLGAVSGVQYPALLLRVGLFDTNVPYWDPAKYMARLRSLARRDGGVGVSLRLMQVSLGQGPVKPGGHETYDNVADDAAFCAFVLWSLRMWPGKLERVGTRKPGTQ